MAGARRDAAVMEPPTESEQHELEHERNDQVPDVGGPEPGPAPPEATIFERMVAIISELPAIGKTQRNEQQEFNFRGHDDVMNALNPLLSKHGVFMVPRVLERVALDTRKTQRGSTMYEVNLHVEYTFYGATGDSFVASAWGEGTDMGDKATNKAMTMAFKNVVAQSFAINTQEASKYDADKDSPDETTTHRPDVAVDHQPQPPANWPDALKRFDAMRLTGEASEWLAELVELKYGKTSLGELTQSDRREAFVLFASATMLLEERYGDLSLTNHVRPLIQAAFSERLGGLLLAGPAWSLDPSEAETRPTRDGVVSARASGGEAKPGEGEASQQEPPPEA